MSSLTAQEVLNKFINEPLHLSPEDKDYLIYHPPHPICKFTRESFGNDVEDSKICDFKGKCQAQVFCHPYSNLFLESTFRTPEYPLCGLSYEMIKNDKDELMTTNGLCIPCLRKKVCCEASVHSLPSFQSKDDFTSPLKKSNIESLVFALNRISEVLNVTIKRISSSEFGSSERRYVASYFDLLDILNLVDVELPSPFNDVIPLNNDLDINSNENNKFTIALNYLIEKFSTYNSKYSFLDISNGQELDLGNLFEINIHSLKMKDAEGNIINSRLVYQIVGRTDLLCVEGNSPSRLRTLFGINIKSSINIYSLREAITQMISLNTENRKRSPSIILTDLKQYYLLIYLTCHVEGYEYSIELESFKTFDEVVKRSFIVSERKISTRFAMRITPLSNSS